MTEKRFQIEVLNNEHWMIEDTLTGCTANPVDGTANVLKGLINTMNMFYEEKENLSIILEDKTKLMMDRINELGNNYEELEKENEQLKQQLKIYKNDGLETLNDLERAYENNKKALNNIEQLDKENKELKHENVNIMSDLDYYRAKSGSCEEGLFQKDREIAKLEKENKELKEEVQLLKEGMEAYENSIPYVCTCEQVRDIHSEMFDFKMKQSKFYKEHPSRCTVIIDGVRYE